MGTTAVVVALLSSSCARAEPTTSSSDTAVTSISTVSVASPAPTELASSSAGSASEPDTNSQRETPIYVQAADLTLALRPHIFGNRTYSADGPVPDPLPDVGSASEIVISYLPGWTFDATFQAAGRLHARRQTVPLQPTADGSLTLRPAGRAGAYDVTLFGSGYGLGQVIAALRWTTPVDGPLPVPEALIVVVSPGKPGKPVRGYGVGLTLTNLAVTPKTAAATVTVTSSDGHVIAMAATDESGPRPVVLDEGSVYLHAPGVYPTTKNGSIPASAVAALGAAPYTYEVELELDGVRHTATARWPEDELPDDQPRARLEFDPPLPALQ